MGGFNVAQAWNDLLLQACMRPDNAKRLVSYRCNLAYRDQPAGKHRHIRDTQAGLARLRPKAMLKHLLPLAAHKIGETPALQPNLSVRRHPRKPNRHLRQPSLRIRRAT